MISNKKLLKYCLDNPANIMDDNFRIDKELVIIPRVSTDNNELTKAAKELIELFTEMDELNKKGNYKEDKRIADRIIEILKTEKNIHFFPFNFYCQTQGVTKGLFLKLTYDEKLQLIKDYIVDRHRLYLECGYTKALLQVTCDSYAHKRHGDTGTRKIRVQAENHGIKHIDYGEENYYLNPDKGDQTKFKSIIKKENITYPYYYSRNAKMPDLFLKINGKYIIVEHKHMSQIGGHQNSVIVDIKDFIDEADDNVYYVSYIDGPSFQKYFNINFSPDIDNKNNITNKNINDIFEKNERSYIVNTAGFDKLLDELL